MENNKQELKKNLGISTAMATVVGCVIGSGVFLKPQAIYTATGGAPGLGMIAWLITGLVCIAAAMTFAEVAIMIPKTGGMVAYLEEAFGRKVGFLAGWMQTILFYPAMIAALSVAFAQQAALFVGDGLILPVAIVAIIIVIVLNGLGSAVGGGAQVVKEGGQQAAEDDHQIVRGQPGHVLRGLHQGQQGPQQEQGGQAQHQGEQAAEDRGQKPLLPEAGQIPAAILLGKEDGDACAAAAEEKKEQVHHRPRHPDGGKGGLPGEAADDHGVYGVVQLLEDVPKNQGEGQRHQLGRDGAPGQGGGLHSVSPHSFIR